MATETSSLTKSLNQPTSAQSFSSDLGSKPAGAPPLDDLSDPAPGGRLSVLANKIMPHGGILASCFSFCAASMGAGTLGLPAAMKAAGSVNGSLMLVLVCASTVYSMRLLAVAVERTGYQTFEQMSRGFVGKWFERFVAFLIVAFCWGCSVAYVVTVNDVMSKINVASWFPEVFKTEAGQRGLTSIYWGVLMLPLSLAREINALRYASALGVCSTIFLVSSIFAHSVDAGPQVAKKNLTYFEFDISMVVALPTFIFSYCCQTNAFEIYTEMKPRTVNQMTKNGTLSLVVCTCLYIIAGVSGFANFGSDVRGNILNNLDPLSSAYVAVAFFAVTITVTAAFPIVIFPTRDAVLQVIGYESAYNCPTWVRILVCAILAVCSLICGLFVPNISVLFGILGGVCGSTIAFILPAVFYMKSFSFKKEEEALIEEGEAVSCEKKDDSPASQIQTQPQEGGFCIKNAGVGNYIFTWLLLIVGVVAGVLGTAVSMWQTITGQSS